VVEPDLFKGDPAPADLVTPGFNVSSWITKHPTPEIDEMLEKTIKYIRGDIGAKKVGAVGYCFGGKYVARFMAKGKGLDAGFVAHPSRLEKVELEALSGPFSVAAAGVYQRRT
jgi:dienelactone hydrolase